MYTMAMFVFAFYTEWSRVWEVLQIKYDSELERKSSRLT